MVNMLVVAIMHIQYCDLCIIYMWSQVLFEEKGMGERKRTKIIIINCVLKLGRKWKKLVMHVLEFSIKKERLFTVVYFF